MNRASPVDMRKALETVQALKDAGILFVPIPIMNEAHHEQLQVMFNNALLRFSKVAMPNGLAIRRKHPQTTISERLL